MACKRLPGNIRCPRQKYWTVRILHTKQHQNPTQFWMDRFKASPCFLHDDKTCSQLTHAMYWQQISTGDQALIMAIPKYSEICMHTKVKAILDHENPGVGYLLTCMLILCSGWLLILYNNKQHLVHSQPSQSYFIIDDRGCMYHYCSQWIQKVNILSVCLSTPVLSMG
jgi:hypothetical protein